MYVVTLIFIGVVSIWNTVNNSFITQWTTGVGKIGNFLTTNQTNDYSWLTIIGIMCSSTSQTTKLVAVCGVEVVQLWEVEDSMVQTMKQSVEIREGIRSMVFNKDLSMVDILYNKIVLLLLFIWHARVSLEQITTPY